MATGKWDLNDLAATGDIAKELGASKTAVSNWIARFLDFPMPLKTLSVGPVYSMRQVREWHDSRKWQRPDKRCATIGCANDATDVMTYTFRGDTTTDKVCGDCLAGYQRMPAITVESVKKIK